MSARKKRKQRLGNTCVTCRFYGIHEETPTCYYDFQDEVTTSTHNWCANYLPRGTVKTSHLIDAPKGRCCATCGYTPIKQDGNTCPLCGRTWEGCSNNDTSLDCLNNTDFASYEDYSRTFDAVEDIPTTNALISCNERMPDKDGKYLVLLNNNAWDTLDYDTELKQFGWTDDYKDELGYNITEWYDSTKMVVSWMPLPEKL